ncbi:MAG: RDD family protein [Planctomycetaceae bacterium]
MGRQTKMDRVHFDFFQCVTLGMRTIFWPGVMLIPFVPVIAVVALLGLKSGNLIPLWVVLGILAAIPLLVLPLAIVHMTAKYTYKAWILWELSKVFVRNIAPALYWVLMALVTFIVPMGAAAAALQLFGGGVNPFANKYYLDLTGRLVTMVLGEDQGWQFTAVAGAVRFVLAFVVATPILMLAGFPLVLLMRANGLLGYYRQLHLDLVPMMAKNTPCGFWVRMLAFLVDALLVPLAIFISVKEKRAMMVGMLFTAALGLTFLFRPGIFLYVGIAWLLYMWWMYFCVQESTTQRTTIGKDGFGLIVSTEDNKQMSLGVATKRFFSTLLTLLTLFLGFVMCAFHPQKKALHDIVSKTRVVWEGDK